MASNEWFIEVIGSSNCLTSQRRKTHRTTRCRRGKSEWSDGASCGCVSPQWRGSSPFRSASCSALCLRGLSTISSDGIVSSFFSFMFFAGSCPTILYSKSLKYVISLLHFNYITILILSKTRLVGFGSTKNSSFQFKQF